jgi:hypothetical protein
MPVEAVVGDVQLPVGEPPVERSLRIVEGLGWLPVPGDPLECLVVPEPQPVGLGLLVDLRSGIGRGRELGRRREYPILGEKGFDRFSIFDHVFP